MNVRNCATVALAAALGLGSLGVGVPGIGAALAQQAPAGAQNRINTLPPALRAAVLAGNPQQITQAINALSGGNPQQAATLASSVVAAAEQLVTTNPQAAIQAAGAAVETVRAGAVQTSSPQQTESVLTTAARIFVSPPVQQAVPLLAANVATATMSAASTINNPSVAAGVSVQAVALAEGILVTSPAAAVQLAGAAVQSVQTQQMQAGAPGQTMSVVSGASRVSVSPEAQRVAPQTVAGIAVAVTQIVSNPVVYQTSPQSAINTMTNAYAAATSQTVISAVPSVTATVTSNISQAGGSVSLGLANSNNAAQVNQILAGQTQPTTTLPGSTTTTNTTNTTTTNTTTTNTTTTNTTTTTTNTTNTNDTPTVTFTNDDTSVFTASPS